LPFSSAEPYMQLAVYDLLGALFAPSDPPADLTLHGQAVRARLRRIKDGFSDPDFGPFEVAAEAGISLRYVQKLFTERGSTCSEFIYSLRLDRAAHLLTPSRLAARGPAASARSLMVAGFATNAHLHENFAIGLVILRARTPGRADEMYRGRDISRGNSKTWKP